MKLALATLLLASVASLPRTNARIGIKAKATDPHKPHMAQKAILQNRTEHRIIGGDAAEPGEFPFYVKFQGWDGGYCGASLIHEDIVLTAAHCDAVWGETVSIGAYYLNEYDENEEFAFIESRHIHPNYDELDSFKNDVMVLKLTSPSSRPTITLNDDSASPIDGEDVTVIGLGLNDYDANTAPDSLHKLTIQVVDHDQCAAYWDGVATIYEDVMVCAGVQEGDKSACNGDSGGPLLEQRGSEYVQVGIVSWGMEGCVPNTASGYVRVSGVKDWIDQMICEHSGNPPASCSDDNTGPTKPPADDTDPPTPPADCEDVPGWYDSDGPEYDCAWYEENDACEFASGYENNGYTALEACCICGGGSGGNGNESTPPPTTSNCEDIPGWFDSGGPKHDCAWYEEKDACASASQYENDGYTALEACCYCGGGSA